MPPRIVKVQDSAGKSVEIVDNYGVMHTPLALMDADTGIFFARQLELKLSTAYEVKYPQFQGRSLAPVNSEGGPWTESIVAQVFNHSGTATWATGEDETFPRADISGQEIRTVVRALKTGFGYSWLEIQKAMKNNANLEQRRANAAIFAYEKKLDDVIWGGDSQVNIGGFLSDANVPRGSAAATGTSTGTTFASKTGTPQLIVDDIESAMTKPWLDSGMIHWPNTLLLPPAQYRLISSTRMSTYSDKTILAYLMETSDWFSNGKGKIVPVNKLKNGGPTAGADCMIAYEYNSENLELYIPYAQNFFPVQQKGFQFLVPSLGMTGGIVWRYPKSANIVESI